MRRFLSCILLFALLFSLCACFPQRANENSADITEDKTTKETTLSSPETTEEKTKNETTEEEITPQTSSTAAPEITEEITTTTAPATTKASVKTSTTTKATTTTKPSTTTTKPTSTTTAKPSTTTTTKSITTTTKPTFTTTIKPTTTACPHTNTVICDQKDATETSLGYTGDTYCEKCGVLIKQGTSIPKTEPPKKETVIYHLPDGTLIEVDASIQDVTAYFMALKTQKTNHLYLEVEKEIVRLCNIEREKEGLSPLSWFEDAYYFTKIRADEAAQVWSHTRPNGTPWHTVYFDAGVVITGSFGENLYESIGYAIEEYAAASVEAWMNSPGHRANILNQNYTRIAVAIVADGNRLTATQNFFS